MSIDLDLRNVINGIGRALGPLARAEVLTRLGSRDAELAIGEDLGAAIIAFRKVKQTPGMTVATYIGQSQLFARELTQFQEIILQDINDRSRSAKRIATVIRNYGQSVIDSPPPGQGSLIDLGPTSKESLWAQSVARADMDPTGISPGLFGLRLPRCTDDQTKEVLRCVHDANDPKVNPWAICQLSGGCATPDRAPVEIEQTDTDGELVTIVSDNRMAAELEDILIQLVN